MSENKALIARLVQELWVEGKLGVVDEIFAADYVDQSAGMPPGMARDREGQKEFVQAFRGAFPDMVGTIEDSIAEGDKVAVRWTAKGTHEGDFMGIPATGKSVHFTGTSVYRIAGGLIAEEWTEADMMGLMTQLGAVPDMATA